MKKKKIILFSFTALMICLVAVLSCFFINNKCNNSSYSSDYLIATPVKSNKMKLTTRKYANDGDIDFISGCQITATVNDYDTSYDELVWKLDFSCECCVDKLTLVKDSETIYHVLMSDYFEHQAKLIVSSKLNPNVSAQCLFNCNKRSLGLDGSLSLFNDNCVSINSYDCNSREINLTDFGLFHELCYYYFSFDLVTNLSFGNFENDIDNSAVFVLSDPLSSLASLDDFDDFRNDTGYSGMVPLNQYCSVDGIYAEHLYLGDLWKESTGLDLSLFIEPQLKEFSYYYLKDKFSAIDFSHIHFGTLKFISTTIGSGTGEEINQVCVEFDIYINISNFVPKSINSINLDYSGFTF